MWQFTPFAWLYFLAIAMSLGMAFLAWRMRPVRGAAQFSLLCLFSGVWALGYVLGFFNTHLAWKLVALRIEYLGITGTIYLWLLFVCVYVNYDHWLTRPVRILHTALPVITMLQVLFIAQHHFFYRSYGLGSGSGLVLFAKVYGPGFYIWTSYSYLIFALGGIILIWGILRMPNQFKGQTLPIILVMGLTLLFNFLYLSGKNPLAPYDPTSLSFVVLGVLFLFLMRYYRFLDIVPVAYNLVFKHAKTGVVILDERRHILDMNPAAETIFARGQKEALGRPVGEALPSLEEGVQGLLGKEPVKADFSLDEEDCFFELQVTPLKYRSGKPGGHMIMLFDVSERKQMAREQARLIAQLEKSLDQVQTLSGLLPICAQCKKIRDDQGYWHQVEVYISNHSDTHFSHGLCPDCLDELYASEKALEHKVRKKKEE